MLYIIDELLYFNFSILLIFTACHLQNKICWGTDWAVR